MLHTVLAEQKWRVKAEAQRAAHAALHMAFSMWCAAKRAAPVANEGTTCAVVDGLSAVTGVSTAAAGGTSAAADVEPAGMVPANGAGTAGRLPVATSDTLPAASAESKGSAAPTTRCCMHMLTTFWAPQKWCCSMCVCIVLVGTCMQHCMQCDLDYCTDCRPAGTEQAAVRPHFQLKECPAASKDLLEHECKLLPLLGNWKTPGCCMWWWGCPCRIQLTELCHYLPEVHSLTKANTNMANPMQNKWVCDECYMCVPNLSWEPLQLKEFHEMQAVFTLPQPMLPATVPAGMTSIKPAACNRVSMQSASASPGAVAPFFFVCDLFY